MSRTNAHYVVEIVQAKLDKKGNPDPKGSWGKRGKSMFLAFDEKQYGRPVLRSTKGAAEPFASKGAADFASSAFWDSHWDKAKYHCRMTTYVKAKKVSV